MSLIFKMIKYHGKEYPEDIPLEYDEISAHFDVTGINVSLPMYSLHTEYSYGKRKLENSKFYDNLSSISVEHKDKVPQLWKNDKWSNDFAEFIFELVGESSNPSIIEVHPPFSDYTNSIEEFIDRYVVFERKVREKFPNVQVLIENRCGSLYRGGKFIISKLDSIIKLSEIIDQRKINLKFALDIPQLFTAHNLEGKKINDSITLLDEIIKVRHNIAGVHLWGKTIARSGRRVAHCGNLDTYFGDKELKNKFLERLVNVFDDGIERKLVLEVNSGNEDLLSIIDDLRKVGTQFV